MQFGNNMKVEQERKHLSALETLYKTTLDPSVGFDDKVEILLTLGTEVFGLALGILSRIDGDVYTVTHIVGPEGIPPPGTTFDLSDTYCVHTLAANAPKSFHHAGRSDIREHPCYRKFQLESYIGAPIFVENVRYGTLNFSSPNARKEPFTKDDHSLINLCAQWIGGEIFRRESHIRLLEQKTLFESMFQSVPDIVIILSADRIIKMTNPAFSRSFGYTAAEVRGKPTSMLYADEEEWKRQGNIRYNAGAEPDISPYLIQCRHKDGHVFWSENIGAPLRDPEDRLLGFLVAGRDITERLQAESAKQEFISTVSHELRTPLTSIKGSLGLIRSGTTGQLPDKLKSILDIAYKNSDRLELLVNDILDMEKIEAGRMDFHIEAVNIVSLVEEAIVANKGYGDEYGVTFIRGTMEEALADGDKDRLMQVLSNLMSNAAKFSPGGKQVELSVTSLGKAVRVSVKDTGPGIPEEFRGRIFGKFSQADSSDTRQKGGTGLGLSITKAIVEQHGGAIGFETEVGVGSTFFFTLPVAK
jgi:PAS domain S-box-containing protein